MNSKALTAGLTAFALLLAACSGTSGKRIHLTQKDAAGQNGGANNKGFQTDDKATQFRGEASGCLDLEGLSQELKTRQQQAFVMYTKNVDVSISTAPNFQDFKTSTSSNLDQKIVGTVLDGVSLRLETALNNPISKVDITSYTQLDGLLAVQDQKNCESITMLSPSGQPIAFTVVDKMAGMILIANADRSDVRKYTLSQDGGSLAVELFTPYASACANAPKNLVVQQSVAIDWTGMDKLKVATQPYIQNLKALGATVPAFADATASKDQSGRINSTPQDGMTYVQYAILKNAVDSWTYASVCK